MNGNAYACVKCESGCGNRLEKGKERLKENSFPSTRHYNWILIRFDLHRAASLRPPLFDFASFRPVGGAAMRNR